MAVDITNIGVPQVANPAIVALAVDAGIVPLIESLVPLAVDRVTLLIQIKEALGGGANPPNPELAAALNTQVLDAILGYMASLPGARVVPADQARRVLDQDGPASVNAARDVGQQVNVSFPEPGGSFTGFEIYVNERRWAETHSTAAGWVSAVIQNVPAGPQTIRVCYVDANGATTEQGKHPRHGVWGRERERQTWKGSPR